MEVPSGMRPAPNLNQPSRRVLEEGVIAAIGICLQVSLIALEEALWSGALPRWRVVIQDDRMIGISIVWPDAPGARERQLCIQYLHARIVGPDHLGLEKNFLGRGV